MRLAVIIVAALVVVGGTGVFLAGKLPELFSTEKVVADYAGPGSGEALVKVPRGASNSAIGAALVDAGVVKSQEAFAEALTAHATAQGKAAVLSYGTYSLKEGMTAKDALAAMLDRKNLKQDGVTIPEGRTVSATFDRLSSVTGIPVEEFEKAAEDPAALGLPDVADGKLEGWLAPATYPFEEGTTAAELLSTMIAKQVTVLGDLKIDLEDAQAVLTKASLVEAEAPADARGKVARVIENRLAINKPFEFDSTIHYIKGERSADMTTTADDRAVDNPYNTYKYPGLPPGPIGSPGKAALEAVLDPTPGEWLFFVTVNGDTGETVFSNTYPEHLVQQERYREWLREFHARESAKPTEKASE